MRAARMHAFGGPEVLELDEVPVPEPKEGEVLVRVYAASVNPVDYKIRSGRYPVANEDLPLVLGRDVAGMVERIGPNGPALEVGDAVYGVTSRGFAEYVTLHAEACSRKPRRLDFVRAAAVPLAGLTAWQGLMVHGGLRAGQRVLVHGGAGGVGHLAIQIAKAHGAWVATTVRGDDIDFVRRLGADVAIDYQAERFEERAQQVDLVLDLVGGDTQARSFAVLEPGGLLVSSVGQPPAEKARELGVHAQGFVTRADAGQLATLARLIDERRIEPHVLAIYELSEVRQAMARLEDQHTRGKVVLKVAA